MKVSIEMSLYPLTNDYIPSIDAFLADLNAVEGLTVTTNALSTQVVGDYDLAMSTLQSTLKSAFESGPTFSLVTKILNVDITESEFYG